MCSEQRVSTQRICFGKFFYDDAAAVVRAETILYLHVDCSVEIITSFASY